MKRLALLFLLLAAGVGLADDPGIRVPSPPVVPAPMPPAPLPAPDAAITLTPDLIFAVESDAPVLVLSSPFGRVRIIQDTGPVRVRGKFVDGDGTYESREFKSKHVVWVEPLADGPCELLVARVGEADATKVIRRNLDVKTGLAPRPPPDPEPDPEPEPTTKSPWDNAPGLRVLIVYPLRDSLPASQQAIVTGARVRDFLDANTAKEGGKPAYWILKSGEDVSGLPGTWQRAFATTQGDKWVVVGNGAKWTARPLPADPDAMLKLLEGYR